MTLRAPWTQDQVDALNAYQHLGAFHPYTCLQPHEGTARYLVATTEGWVCTQCPYTQNWAHDRAVTLGIEKWLNDLA